MSKSFLNQQSLPRGLRNNNPGNIIFNSANNWQGKIPLLLNTDSGVKFEQFENVHYGIRAMMKLLTTYYKRGKTSVTSIISTYAPAFENNTQAYINNVIKMVGNNEIAVLNKDSMIKLAKAIHYVENGSNHFDKLTNEDFEQGYNMAFSSGVNLTPEKKNKF